MNLISLLGLAAGLSMDAFAVAVSTGLGMPRATLKKAAVVGMYFGVFQAVMPLIGYLIATWFADRITMYAHWIAFALLLFLGGKMIGESCKKEGCPDRACPEGLCDDRSCPGGEKPDRREASLKPDRMLPLALATSIDALAGGVTLAFFQVNIVWAVALIGAITLALSMLGVKIGNLFGARLRAKAELAGGSILILLGLKILLEGLGLVRL